MAGTVLAYEMWRSGRDVRSGKCPKRPLGLTPWREEPFAQNDPILAQVSRADLRSIYTDGLQAVAAAADLAALEAARVRFLGRKAELVLLLRSIAELPPEERREVGKMGNLIRVALEEAVEIQAPGAGDQRPGRRPGQGPGGRHAARLVVASGTSASGHSDPARDRGHLHRHGL